MMFLSYLIEQNMLLKLVSSVSFLKMLLTENLKLCGSHLWLALHYYWAVLYLYKNIMLLYIVKHKRALIYPGLFIWLAGTSVAVLIVEILLYWLVDNY